MQTQTAQTGHNNPPSDIELLQARLQEKHSNLLDRAADLCEAVQRMPQEIGDDETAGKAGDLIKLLNGAKKNLEAERVAEKEPFLSQGRAVDGFFKFATDKLDTALRAAKAPLDAWLRKKEAEARRQREEEARKLREQQEAEARAAALLAQSKQKEAANSVADSAIATGIQAAKAHSAALAKPSELSATRSAGGALAQLRTRWVGELMDQGTLDLERLRHHLDPVALQKAINSFVAAGGRALTGAKIYEKSETVVK